MAGLDIIISAIDKASPVINKLGANNNRVTSFCEKNWMKYGAAAAGAATAIEVFARKQAPMLEKSRQIAVAIGMNEKAFRNLAIETSNVTFPMEDVLNLMELGKQAGLKSADALKEYATFWDTVGDATGEGAVQLGKAGVALRGMGIDLGNENEALAAFGYITESTNGSIGEFLKFLDRCGPDLREMNMDVEQSAAILGILEKEFGMSARTARTEFMQAVIASEGNMGILLETLGVSEETFKSYTAEVSNSSEVIQRNADIHAKSYTPIQKLQHVVSELGFKFAGSVEQAAKFAPALYAVGPAMKAFSLGSGALGKIMSGSLIPALVSGISSVWAFTAALLANPMTWVVIGIVALIAAIVLLYKNWDKVTAFFQKTFKALKDTIKNVIDFFKSKFPNIADIAGSVFKKVSDVVKNIWGPIGDWIENLWGGIKDYLINIWESISDYGVSIWKYFVHRLAGVWGGITGALKGFVNVFIQAINWVISAMNKFRVTVPEWVPVYGGKTWGFNIPKIPYLHKGGVFRSATPGGEGLAMLKDREVVIEEGKLKTGNNIEININEGAVQINALRLDDDVIEGAGDKLFDIIYKRFLALGIEF